MENPWKKLTTTNKKIAHTHVQDSFIASNISLTCSKKSQTSSQLIHVNRKTNQCEWENEKNKYDIFKVKLLSARIEMKKHRRLLSTTSESWSSHNN